MQRHDLDFTSLVSGGIFVAVGVLFLLDYSAEPGWVAALLLIGLGLAGLLSTVSAARSEAAPAPFSTSQDESSLDE